MAVRAWATVSAEAKGSSQPPRQSGRKMSIRERRSMSLSFERMPQGGLSPRVGLFPAIRILDGLALYKPPAIGPFDPDIFIDLVFGHGRYLRSAWIDRRQDSMVGCRNDRLISDQTEMVDRRFLFESLCESKGLCCELLDLLQRICFALLGDVFAFRRATGETPVHIFPGHCRALLIIGGLNGFARLRRRIRRGSDRQKGAQRENQGENKYETS